MEETQEGAVHSNLDDDISKINEDTNSFASKRGEDQLGSHLLGEMLKKIVQQVEETSNGSKYLMNVSSHF